MKLLRSMSSSRPASAVVISLLGLVGCGLNQSGNVGASQTGDTSNPAARGSPLEALREACGDGEPTAIGAQAIKRHPYLQQVTTSSAMVGWSATELANPHVEVTLPDGTAVMTAPGEIEIGEVRMVGRSQMWAQLDALDPATTYCYALVDDTGPLTARTGFKTAPTADSTEPIRFLVYGDSGGGSSDQYDLLDQMHTVPHDLIVHTGDIAYDDGKLTEFENNVFRVYTDMFRNLPFFPIAGNHDYNTQNGAAYRDVFAIPGDSGEKWYSYDWGRVHFAAIDTEADYATQAAWLDADLAASSLPWKIVYMHRPTYSSGEHGSDLEARKAFAPVFERHGVQLVLAGHDHHYERMIPQHGVAYMVTGGGGRGTRATKQSSFTALVDEVIHFVMVEVGVDELVVHAIDATGQEFDSLVVPRVPAPTAPR